jgi:hypothetical protein
MKARLVQTAKRRIHKGFWQLKVATIKLAALQPTMSTGSMATSLNTQACSSFHLPPPSFRYLTVGRTAKSKPSGRPYGDMPARIDAPVSPSLRHPKMSTQVKIAYLYLFLVLKIPIFWSFYGIELKGHSNDRAL